MTGLNYVWHFKLHSLNILFSPPPDISYVLVPMPPTELWCSLSSLENISFSWTRLLSPTLSYFALYHQTNSFQWLPLAPPPSSVAFKYLSWFSLYPLTNIFTEHLSLLPPGLCYKSTFIWYMHSSSSQSIQVLLKIIYKYMLPFTIR